MIDNVQDVNSHRVAPLLARISLAMMVIVALQSLKYLSIDNNQLHLLNTLLHLLCFYFCFLSLQKHQALWGSVLLFCCFSSYIVSAVLLWQQNVGLQYFLLLALFVLSTLFPAKHPFVFLALCAMLVLSFLALNVLLSQNLGHIEASQQVKVMNQINSVTLSISCLVCAFLIRLQLGKNWRHVLSNINEKESFIAKLLPYEYYLKFTQDVNSATVIDKKHCSVIYLDLVNSCQLLQDYEEEALYSNLHRVFSLADKVIEHHNAYRLKTNGDQIICLMGIESAFENENAELIANKASQLALALRTEINQQQFLPSLQVRISVASGNVFANFTSDVKPSFDVWGKTMVRAARLEKLAGVNSILLDEASYYYCANKRKTSPLELVFLKGIGLSKMAELQS